MPRKRVNRRKQAKQPKRNFRLPTVDWNRLFNGALLFAVGVGIWTATTWLLAQPINSVRIDGPFERVSALQIEAAVTPYLEDGFLATNLGELRQIIVDLPWVQDVTVRRSWPSTVSIKIIEEQAAACWSGRGLLNVYGELFVTDATHIPVELPQLSGPPGTELQVSRRFFDINSRLEQRGLNAVGLTVDERGSWTLSLSNGMEVRFGSIAIESRTARFFLALDQVLTPLADKVDYIDMRYTNGFAIGWKPVGRMKLADSGETDPHV
ncbi:MAG: cell division protein FtsQ/DivIB [Gammaproteobacteria bacterium]